LYYIAQEELGGLLEVAYDDVTAESKRTYRDNLQMMLTGTLIEILYIYIYYYLVVYTKW
jgi:hypothetical protein